jgi:HK97 family phage major capsid protein
MHRKLKTGTLYRSLKVSREAISEASRTVSLAFSSEVPVLQWFGYEILDHSPSSVRLGRLKDKGPLLLDHDTTKHIGVVEGVDVGTDRVGRSDVRFGKSELAESAFQDVLDEIRVHVSVGYIIHTMVRVDDIDGKPAFKAIDWEPTEVSLVAVPADTGVGIGRSAEFSHGDHETQVEGESGDEADEGENSIDETEAETEIPANRNQSNHVEIKMAEHDQPSGVDTEKKRVNDLTQLADAYAEYGARDKVFEFIRTGKSADQFKDHILEAMTARHSDARDVGIGMDEKEIQQYSLSRALAAAVSGDWSKAGFERSASEAVAKKMGRAAEGFYIPVDAFSKRAFNAGTAGEAGNLIQTSVLGGEFVDILRNAMVFQQLGVRFLGGLTNNIAIPRKATTSAILSLAETATSTVTGPTTNQLLLGPKRIGAHIDYSKQALIQGNPDIDAMLQDDLAKAIAVQIEYLGFNGTASGDQPRGLFNTSGIGAVVGGTNGAALTWSHLVDLESACANSNSEPDMRAGYAINTKTRGALKKTQKAANLPFIWDSGAQPVNSYRAAVTNNIPSNGTKGTATGICSSLAFGSDWSDLIIALFGGFDVVVDPYTLATSGQVRITGNQFIDVGVRQVASFAAMTDALA